MTSQETAMTGRSVRRRIRLWSGRGGALRYRWYERVADWWCATRDARSGLPVTPVSGGEPVAVPPLALTPQSDRPDRRWGTPRTVLLGQLGRGRAEREWVRYQAETADLQVAKTQAEARGKAADVQREGAEQRLHELGETPKDHALTAVAPGEETASPEVKQGRRRREHAARVQALQAEIQQWRDAAEAADLEQARLAQQIRIRHDVARVRVAMIEAYVRRRCTAYLTRLVRRHPDGERIGALLRSGWSEQPSWLTGAGAS